MPSRAKLLIATTAVTAALLIAGCRASGYRRDADRTAYGIIEQKQCEALGRTEPFSIETPAQTLRRRLLLDQQLPYSANASLGPRNVDRSKQWPDEEYLDQPDEGAVFADRFSTTGPLRLTLSDALQIAAHESREYQTQKESVFEAALRLDLERDAFRNTWTGVLDGLYEADLEREVALDDQGHTDRQTVGGLEYGGILGWSERLRNGMTFTGQIGLDMVSLLTQERLFSRGVFADVTVTIPLMRGAGEFVVAEPLTQAERDVVYAIYDFERYKRVFAVDIASAYLGVQRQQDQVDNAESNYRRLIASTRRARRLADAGRLPEIQVDQSRQDELSARNRWVSALAAYERALDTFKSRLGLPTDAAVELDRTELAKLTARATQLLSTEEPAAREGPVPAADDPVELVAPGVGAPGPLELDERDATIIALARRLDLRVTVGQVYDAQRTVAVAADQLRADVTLLGSGSAGARRTLGSAALDDADFEVNEGLYSALLTVDLPFERTAERNSYRASLIRFEQAVRNVQDLEDQIKLAVRNRLSELLEARESFQIQAQAVTVAERRVESTSLFLEAGRAEIRDVLEAQSALVSAQNALTAAVVNYRVSELALQRDLGVLEVNEQGLWQEFFPTQKDE
ncbi:MAG: TolC family protein [Planctomycetes bacterium]|nr:TolC family protein [Planctomycetota bacterium]